MKIFVVFPRNNPVDSKHLKPVVLAGLPYVIYSKYVKDITVISAYVSQVQTPFSFSTIYINKQDSKSFSAYLLAIVTKVKASSPSIIEVHQDIKLAGSLAKIFPHIKVSVVKHSVYAVNRFKERFFFFRKYFYYKYLKYLTTIFCVSNYVQASLFQAYPKLKDKFVTYYNSYGHLPLEDFSQYIDKRDIILFAGKLIKQKGIIEFLESLPKVLVKYPTYQAVIIGASFSRKNKNTKDIETILKSNTMQQFIQNQRVVIYTNLSNKEVFGMMQQSKIVVISTKTPEAFGLVCLEAHLAKCAVISSGTGGLKEVSGDNALYLPSISANNIARAVDYLIDHPTLLTKMTQEGYTYTKAKFNPTFLVEKLDNYRRELLHG